jgi:DNA mismatch endonuclease (patch repair protein)
LPAENAPRIVREVADTFNKADRSRIMAAVRSRGNKATEAVLVTLFREAGVRGWRRHASLPGKPDFVFAKERVVVFVDGCFWHGCSTHCRMPASNREYWDRKIHRNVERDRTTRRELRARGWKVLRVWEHELKSRPSAALNRIVRSLGAG